MWGKRNMHHHGQLDFLFLLTQFLVSFLLLFHLLQLINFLPWHPLGIVPVFVLVSCVVMLWFGCDIHSVLEREWKSLRSTATMSIITSLISWAVFKLPEALASSSIFSRTALSCSTRSYYKPVQQGASPSGQLLGLLTLSDQIKLETKTENKFLTFSPYLTRFIALIFLFHLLLRDFAIFLWKE